MYRVRSGAAELIEPLIHEAGGNAIELILAAGLRQSQFRDPDTYIAYDKLADLMERCASQLDRPFFGLQLAERQPPSVLGDLPMIASRAPTVADAIDAANKYLYLHASGVAVEQETRGDMVRLTLHLNLLHGRPIDQLMQMSVGHLALFLASLQARDHRSLSLHLRQPAPQGASVKQATRFQSVVFGDAFDGVVVSTKQMASPTHQDETALDAHLEAYLQKLRRQYPNRLEEQVSDTIGRLLPTGECSVEWVASALGMHHRTLQSRLRELGISYRQLLRRTRQRLAEQHLRFDSLSVTDLALQLGYAEVAVFSRHFRQWTGLSPRAWQKHQRSPGRSLQ